MRLARAGAGYVPAHARPPRSLAPTAPDRDGTSATRKRSRSWTPVLVIALIYLVAVGVNEWRLQQRVAELRTPAPLVEPVNDVSLEPIAVAD